MEHKKPEKPEVPKSNWNFALPNLWRYLLTKDHTWLQHCCSKGAGYSDERWATGTTANASTQQTLYPIALYE
ncbi:hypothetical protein TYRP_022039 [Tyrophagus putrescentiae]|nr:hypothetical protein TYRP_022039 [Tyrophagus putrescentiae]